MMLIAFGFTLVLLCGMSIQQEGESVLDMFPAYTAFKQSVQKDVTELKTMQNDVNELKGRKHGCQSGIAGIGYSNPPPLGKSRTTTFTFSPSFEEVPVITYGFEELDTDKDTNVRVKAYISDVTKTGFKMKLYTWGTSKTINIVASWMACPKFR